MKKRFEIDSITYNVDGERFVLFSGMFFMGKYLLWKLEATLKTKVLIKKSVSCMRGKNPFRVETFSLVADKTFSFQISSNELSWKEHQNFNDEKLVEMLEVTF